MKRKMTLQRFTVYLNTGGEFDQNFIVWAASAKDARAKVLEQVTCEAYAMEEQEVNELDIHKEDNQALSTRAPVLYDSGT